MPGKDGGENRAGRLRRFFRHGQPSKLTVRTLVQMALTIATLMARPAMAVDEVHGSAHLSYRLSRTETEGAETSSTTSLYEVYRLSLTKGLTPKMAFRGDLDVTVNEFDGETTTIFAPDLRLDLFNEYFDALVGYRVIERNANLLAVTADGVRRTTKSWFFDLASNLADYPAMRLSFSHDRGYDHLDERQSDSKNTDLSGSLDYAWHFLNFFGTVRRTTMDNYVDGLSQESLSGSGRSAFSRSFLNNRLHASGSYYLTQITTTSVTGAEDVTVYELRLSVQGLYALREPDPGQTLDPLDSLSDGNRGTSTGINIAGPGTSDQQIGLDLYYPREVDQLRIYVQQQDFDFRAFIWEVWSSDDGVEWVLIADPSEFIYDDVELRFEINFPRTEARFFKVVNADTDIIVTGLAVTELEALASRTFPAGTSTEADTLTENAQLNLNYFPWTWLNLGYDVSRYRQDSDFESLGTRTTHAMSARAERDLHRLLRTIGQVQHRMELNSNRSDATTDTASLHFLSSPLDTLEFDLSVSHNEWREDGDLRLYSDSALFRTNAVLRRGAEMELDLRASRHENLASGNTTDHRGIKAALQLLLTRTLTAELEQSLNWFKTTEFSEYFSTYSKATAYWRPSRDVYYRATWRLERDGRRDEDLLYQQYAVNWLPTRKVQLALNYSREDNDGSLSILGVDLAWNISRILSVFFGYDYSRLQREIETTTQAITTELTARF